MPASHAFVPTGRARRYLTQLCQHTSRVSSLSQGHRHDHGDDRAVSSRPRQAEWSDTDGRITLGSGHCALHATAEGLELHAEADDQQRLRQIQDSITRRLEQIGRRDRLTVTWQQVPPRPESAEPSSGPESPATIIEALLTSAGRADPFPLYARLHRLGPVAAIASDSFLAGGYAAVSQVLRDPRFGPPDPTARPPGKAAGRTAGKTDSAGQDALRSMNRSILRANPPDHGRMRSLISQVFTPRRVAALEPAIAAAVDHLLDQLAAAGADGGPADFMDQFAFPLPVTVICELLGVPRSDRSRFRPLAADLTEALELSPAIPGPADAAARELAAYFTHLIDERRTAPGDDLLSALVAARDSGDGRLSDTELLANLILLLVAGFETTTNLLGNGLAILLDQPDLQTALRAGQIPASSFIEEVLRYDSPVQVTTRQARAGHLTVEGLPVPEGSEVILLIGAANRDPARYRDPDHFDPTRPDVRPLSFGAGPHICIGNSLARLEATTAVARLLARFPALAAAPGRPPTRRDRLVLRGHQTLPIQL